MQLVHRPENGSSTVLATTVDFADSVLSQLRGLMFRRSIPDDYALAFRFDSVETQDVHMLFVFFPIDVVWLVDDTVQRVERLRPWLGFKRAEADTIVELPAGTADDVEPGDRLLLVGSDEE
ncbi:DUF192 domain-containing protein [Halopiger xanaduensis]|uniref:DUF192 domain-containing protein n=1 Tax=Halopiger xanaduensis (strain DSM 18323 / JCM 14033 / SH-6) TaxID=797210 RepID=F8D687_HALXS|nr:DUF192 domain-containing protein [Halopiger xanaduensis]AEH35333.1 protein of unknown function DUF192 [Halopiger xanaduensis SH-6]